MTGKEPAGEGRWLFFSVPGNFDTLGDERLAMRRAILVGSFRKAYLVGTDLGEPSDESTGMEIVGGDYPACPLHAEHAG